MSYSRHAAWVLLLLASPVSAQALQAAFEKAQAALDAGNGDEARAGFQALWDRFASRPPSRSAYLVRARLGTALLMTSEPELAEGHLRAAAAGFAADTPEDRGERAAALLDLAHGLERMGRLREAADTYRQARATGAIAPDSAGDIRLRSGLARASIWSDPETARREIDGLLALPPARLTDGDVRAVLLMLRGRVELNAGNPKEALQFLNRAAGSAGGAETRRVNVTDVRIRGDLAIAHQLSGNAETAAKLTTYSGLGALADKGLRLATRMSLPPCRPTGGLAPDAMAVIEFAIGDNGRAGAVSPVYATAGTGGLPDARPEEEFAAAVRGWTWKAEDVAKLDPFWRQSVRLELRCLDEGPGTDSGVWASFHAPVDAWLAARGIAPVGRLPEDPAREAEAARAELARREADSGPESPVLLGPLVVLGENPLLPDREVIAVRNRVLALAAPLNPPPELIVAMRMGGSVRYSQHAGNRWQARDQARALVSLLADLDAAGHGSSRPAQLVRVRLGAAYDGMRQRETARAQFDQVIASPTSLLSESDPIRVEALLRLSNQAAARADLETAAAALKETGLTPEQCATVDVRPVARSLAITTADYPPEAMRWNASGYIRVAYDILPNGRTANARTIVAAPPFLFSDASARAAARFRFEPVFRPDNSVGCTAQTQSMRFLMGP